MFEMQKVGIRIAKLRRRNDMTQTELADKMGVSFQAVSNWERGNSMPDISKLPLLAKVFNVSIDEILGEKSDLVEAAINNEIESYLEKSQDIREEIINAVPILKPNQMETIAKKAEKRELVNVSELLEYMSAKDVYEMAVERINQGKAIGLDYLERMSAEDVSRLAIDEYKKGKAVNMYLDHMDSAGLKAIAAEELLKGNPFNIYLDRMAAYDVYELAVMAINEEKFEAGIFMQHMSAEDAGKIAIMEYKKGRSVKDFLEYIDSESLKEILKEIEI